MLMAVSYTHLDVYKRQAEDIARASAVEKSGVLLGGDLNILRPVSYTHLTMSVYDLMERFHANTGSNLADDRILLAK